MSPLDKRIVQALRLFEKIEALIAAGEVDPVEGRAKLQPLVQQCAKLVTECDRRYRGPARALIEAHFSYNDTYPGDPCPRGGWRS